jgi:arylsulfatase A-like enzyme
VILISVDTLRADHVGCYGYARDTTPALDGLAREGVKFNHAYSQAGWTLPAHMSLMTSRYPPAHGVVQDTVSLPEDAATLAEVLRKAGYATAAVVNWIYVGKSFGFAQGFDAFHEIIPPTYERNPFVNRGYSAAQVTDRGIEILSEERNAPLFLFLHYFDPHADYDPPSPYDSLYDPEYAGTATGRYLWLRPFIKYLPRRGRRRASAHPEDFAHVEALYDGEIRYADAEIGRFLGALEARGRSANSLVVVTADHGEEFNDHGSMEGHGWTLYDEVVHVPLIFRLPGEDPAGVEVDTLAEHIDVAPTILAGLGLELPREFQGRSLWPVLTGESPPEEPRLSFSHTRRFTIKGSVRNARFKLIRTDDQPRDPTARPDPPVYELYDVVADPGESRNLYAERPKVARLLSDTLQRWLESNGTAFDEGARPPRVELSDEEKRSLEALGYVQ